MSRPPFKTRTRAHVVADLSVNHVERFVLRRGHICDEPGKDYGYDLTLYFFAGGQITTGPVLVQLKASDHLRPLRTALEYSFTPSVADLNLWLREINPVILILYDAQADRAYWQYVQRFFNNARTVPAVRAIRVPVSQRLDESAVDEFLLSRDRVAAQLAKVVH